MWVFILQQVTDTLGDTTCSPSQRVTFSQLYSWDSLGTWQMKLGHSRSDCWLWALPSAPGQSKGFQMPVTDALHTKDLHHEIATYSGKELNLFIFFFSHALFLRDFFSFCFLWMYLLESWCKYLIFCLSLRMTKEISSSCRCIPKIQILFRCRCI